MCIADHITSKNASYILIATVATVDKEISKDNILYSTGQCDGEIGYFFFLNNILWPNIYLLSLWSLGFPMKDTHSKSSWLAATELTHKEYTLPKYLPAVQWKKKKKSN